MASKLIHRPISVEKAEQQFDLLFDEYFKDEPYGKALRSQGFKNTGNVLESGTADQEVDEVYIPDERQEPEQLARQQEICEVARQLRELGDRYTDKYGPNLNRAETSLTTLFTQVATLEYGTFKNTVESLTTSDRNVADFVFMMSLSRNVVNHVGNTASKAKNYFRRYIGNNYIDAMADAGGVGQYLHIDFTNTETKLVVLDFLSSQPIERLTARNVRRKTVSFDSLNRHRKTSLSKSSSESSGKSLRKQYSLRLKKDLDEYCKIRGKSVDDLSEKFWGDGFVQAQGSYTEGEPPSFSRLRSQSPLHNESGDTNLKASKPQRKISQELKDGITEFDTQTLRHVEIPEPGDTTASMDTDELRQAILCVSRTTKVAKHHRPESLQLPRQQERRLSPVLSPESQVAARLEQISQEILTEYPDLFHEQISRVSLQDLTYEKFASVARKVIEKHPGGWTRIALVCYFARELALEDESTDEQLDSLVSFSSRFISETSSEWIASQGGWGALEEDSVNLSPFKVRQKLKEEPDVIDGLLSGSTSRWLNYLKYGVAALAVGMTVAYNVAR